jgi:hypothetical protein
LTIYQKLHQDKLLVCKVPYLELAEAERHLGNPVKAAEWQKKASECK